MQATSRSGQSGFTLLELLIVIAVIGSLSAVTVFAIGALGDRSTEVSCAADARALSTAEQAALASDGSFADEATLVDHGLLDGPSTYHDVVVDDGDYHLVAVGDCAAAAPRPDEVAEMPAGVDSDGLSEESTQSEQEIQDGADRCVGRVDLNTASAEDLEQIIHIGPARSLMIVDARPFVSVEELESINGIGPSRLAAIQAQGLACV